MTPRMNLTLDTNLNNKRLSKTVNINLCTSVCLSGNALHQYDQISLLQGKDLLCCAALLSDMKIAYTDSDLEWDLSVLSAHVQIEKH